MNSDSSHGNSSKYSFLNNMFRFRMFETLYAMGKSDSTTEVGSGHKMGTVNASSKPADRTGCGEGPANPTTCRVSKEKHSTEAAASRSSKYIASAFQYGAKQSSGDCGKTGAGVAGSRTGFRRLGDPVMVGDDLPNGASNPGLLRYIHNAARYRLPQCFEGGVLSVKQSAKNNWILGHSMSFSSVSPGGYKVLLSYQDAEKPYMPPYFVMEAAPGGQLSCEVRVGPTAGTRATAIAQIADAELYSFESMLDIYLNAATASIIAVNKEFIALHYLQAITRNLSLGGEVVARGPVTELSSASGAVRWADVDDSFSATLGNRGVDICFARNLKPFLTTAVMLEVGFAIRRAVATLAYEWRSNAWTARASIDSDGLVGATLQKALGGKNANLSCAISALLNHPNDKFRLGFALNASII